ncbi:hypothetical protein [Paludibacterium purpuratum]|uniref:Uncharacterized protein n=1 Tax=Paludibacterium purpuratum TaxID=1144873 RepID=A0A4R7B9F6_9NEIS|nr:hypothetical protein [Paludibacterium purpuratum]TDR81451.1 hypothetical protein DFP86_103104 [Paludibacterium purpuratum]
MMKRVFVALIAASLVLPAVAAQQSLHHKAHKVLHKKAHQELDHHLKN